MELELKPGGSQDLLIEPRSLIEDARRLTVAAVNVGLTALCWQIGNRIRREILGKERATYGEQIVATLWRQLSWSHFRELLRLAKPIRANSTPRCVASREERAHTSLVFPRGWSAPDCRSCRKCKILCCTDVASAVALVEDFVFE